MVGEMLSLLVSEIEKQINKNKMDVEFMEKIYDFRGFIRVKLRIDNYCLECSYNEKGYFCWYDHNIIFDKIDESVINKLAKFVSEEYERNYKLNIKAQISELEQEIERLKEEVA